jgi:hypothetical protein
LLSTFQLLDELGIPRPIIDGNVSVQPALPGAGNKQRPEVYRAIDGAIRGANNNKKDEL